MSRYRYRPHRRKYQTENQSSYFTEVTCRIEKNTHNILKIKSEKIGLPIPRLLAIAADNELCSSLPFALDYSVPTIPPYVPNAYTEEAQKIVAFMEKYKRPIGRDLLLLCRRKMGISDRQTFMLAYRQLIKTGEIEELKPPFTITFRYHPTYVYCRLAVTRPTQMMGQEHSEEEIGK